MTDLILKKDLLTAVPFVKKKFYLIFHLFDNQHPHSLGSISRFFLMKLLAGYDMETVSAAIPFDTSSIAQRLMQLGFVEHGNLTKSGRCWAQCIERHEQPYEAWAFLHSSISCLLPADTTILQDIDPGSGMLFLDNTHKNHDDTIFQGNVLKTFEFLSGQTLQPFLSELSERDIKLRSEVCKDPESGRAECRYLVLCLPKGTALCDTASSPIRLSMPVLRCETRYAEPQMHPLLKNLLPPLPDSRTSWTHLLDGSPAEASALSEVLPKNFYPWPSSDWEDGLSHLAPEQRTAVFSTRCSLDLFWRNGVVPQDTVAHYLSKALGDTPWFSPDRRK